jgi:acyl-CoA synthetase (AMP-forming)/AMP-acid ligase II
VGASDAEGVTVATEWTIPGVVRKAAERFGDREAVVDGTRRPTFIEVADSVETVERALIASGVKAGDRVAVWAPNGLDWVLISFAIYGVGAILVPINTRFKGEEAADVLRTAEVRMLFTATDFLGVNYVDLLQGTEQVPALDETVVISGSAPTGTTRWSEFLARADAIDPDEAKSREAALRSGDSSDIVFTSGTTGHPKGAVLRHGASVETYIQWSAGVGIREGDRMLVVYPFFHTAGLKSGILAAFIQGATLVPHPVFDVESVVERITAEQITVLPGPPSVFQSLLNHPKFDSFDLDSLRLSVTGAAVVPVDLIARMREQLHLESVITAYGLTETHGTATICEQSDSAETIASTVGHPLGGLEIQIIGDPGGDAPTGEQGEVLVRGFNVMTEYFGSPEATATAVDAEGWLHTGDIGYLGTDGYLRIVDRKKDIIIVGGFNVSPAEVEAIILRRDDVAQVAVVGVPDGRLGEVGAAFVVVRPGSSVEEKDLMAWCRDHMANYKVPRYVRSLDALPTNSSGKIMKAVLRETASRLRSG